jgi:hypothetical protein
MWRNHEKSFHSRIKSECEVFMLFSTRWCPIYVMTCEERRQEISRAKLLLDSRHHRTTEGPGNLNRLGLII